MDANEVVPNLWVGAMPRPNDVEALNKFDVVVFTADSNQPQWISKFRRTAIRCGIEDSATAITEIEKRRVYLCAKMVAKALFEGKRVLVTCISGWNRSALVAGLALKMSTHYSVDEIITLLRAARGEDALGNRSFVEYLEDQVPY